MLPIFFTIAMRLLAAQQLSLVSQDNDGSPSGDSCIAWSESGTCEAYIDDNGVCVSTSNTTECEDD